MTTTNKQNLTENYAVPASSVAPQVDAAGPTRLSVGQRFLAALARRDFEDLEACFQIDARFRALVPSGIREGTGPQEAVAWLRRWFGDADLFDIQRMDLDRVCDRLRISYRIQLRKGEFLLPVCCSHFPSGAKSQACRDAP